MTPQLRHELARTKHAIDREIVKMKPNGQSGERRPSWMSRRAAPAELPESAGWSVPVELETKDRDGYGKVTVYLSFPPETFNDAEEIIAGLIAEGYPVKVWRKKPEYEKPAYQKPAYQDRERSYRRD